MGGGGGDGGGAVSVAPGAGFAVGGSAGDGGVGGSVQVTNSGAIATGGKSSIGIEAQSLGGGGGNGGWDVVAGTGLTVGIGGSGGIGGAGGLVNVNNSGAIATKSDSAQGILAQSVGGGGGNGGFSFVGNLTPILSTAFSMGGSGDSAGDGAAVTVTNSGSIATGSVTTVNAEETVLGSQAHGIFAQSVGGGGGNGGWSAAGTLSFSVPDVPVSASIAMSLGGSGKSGGKGGSVTVNNLAPSAGSSTIGTVGDHAHGIFAQSLGGGGGNGGGSVAVALDFSVPESLGISCPIALGGKAGQGGAGGQVAVTNQNAVATLGEDSLGILAQSIGGGGGTGGWSVTATLDGAATDSYTVEGSAAIGGVGGSGGTGGAVQVNNTGAVTTSGRSSIGIEAQSVGGGGGNGGWSVNADALFGKTNGVNFNLALGGSGGSGGNAGTVAMTNGRSGNTAIGAIHTAGDEAQGILAQSIGGGGGNGGQSSLYSLRGGIGDNTTSSLTANVTVGGSGGVGGKGGQVTLTNYADISTAGTKSYGLQAQSVGGGGGDGGASQSYTVNPSATKDEEKEMLLPSVNITGTAAVGGGGGDGNDGGAVSVTNAGRITTQGMRSYGIFAQSVGGGGGNGGESYDFSFVAGLSKAGNANKKNGEENAGLNLKETVSVGGNGGGASSGGAVSITNSGAVTTSGVSAYGIFAQSVGGGGGTGGASVTGLEIPAEGYNSWKSWVIPKGDFTVKVGGNGGSCGNGGQVTVGNSGAITTYGEGAFGIYAQSVGGGGGVASYDQSQLFIDPENFGGEIDKGMSFEFLIGGTGGAGGNGGNVQVTNSGAITTFGDQASGIYAQSVGGGGGEASIHGGPWHGIDFMQYFGLAVNIGRSGGSGGSGGAVTVANNAGITTQGDNANGIFAQSVGGAGGSGSQTTQVIQGFLWNGSFLSGAGGNGGPVTVSQTGNIATYGQDAHGIVAQSVAGKDQAGNVAVTLNDPNSTASPGNISANGLGSSGIVAQSLGAGGSGDIHITINQPDSGSGRVQGGHSGSVTNSDGSTTQYSAYGVLIQDGHSNTLTNHGSISTLDGEAGTAVMVQADYGAPYRGNLTIGNYGTITGSVKQGTQAASSMNQGLSLPTGNSTINFNNAKAAVYNAGPTVNLGSGTLTNSGTLDLGGGETGPSVLTGNFTQTADGTFQTTLNGDGSGGSLKVSGMASLDGSLKLNYGPGPFIDGTTYNIMTANTVQNRFSQEILPPSSLLSFTPTYLPQSVELVANAQSFTTVAASSLEMDLGGYHDQVLLSADRDFQEVLGAFQLLPASEHRSAFASFSPAVYDAGTFTTFAITRQFTRSLQERLLRTRQSVLSQGISFQDYFEEPILLASNEPGASLGAGYGGKSPSRKRLGLWIEGFGQYGDADRADSGLSGFDYSMGGAVMGVDYALSRQLVVGADFALAYTDLDLDNNFGSGDIDSMFGSIHGTYFTDRAYLQGIFTYGDHEYDNRRRINIGSIQRYADSDHGADALSFLLEGGYEFHAGEWTLQPFASLFYSHLDEESFRESGADSLDMEVGSRKSNDLSSEVGVRLSQTIKTESGLLRPEIRAGWRHDFDVDDLDIPISFSGAPQRLTLEGREQPENSAALGATLSFVGESGITASLQYSGELAEDFNAHAVAGQIRFEF